MELCRTLESLNIADSPAIHNIRNEEVLSHMAVEEFLDSHVRKFASYARISSSIARLMNRSQL
jgi:hypothetical protein